jgi:hypothetical protein
MNLRYIILGLGVLIGILFFITQLQQSSRAVSKTQVVDEIHVESTESIYKKVANTIGNVTQRKEERTGKPTYQTPGCTWEYFTLSKRIGLWSESCNFEGTIWTLKSTVAQDALALIINGSHERTAIQVLPKSAAQSIEVLKEKVGGPEGCMFQKNDAQSTATRSVYELVPTGGTKRAFELSKLELPPDPCGQYGISASGQRVFEIWSGHEDTVLFLNYGQEGSLFEYDSVRFL